MFVRTATVFAAVAAIFVTLPLSAQKQPPQAGQKAPTVGERLSTAVQSITGSPMAQADTDMKRVLNAFADLNPKPIESLSAQDARRQPSPADGVKAVLKSEGKSDAPLPGVTAQSLCRAPAGRGFVEARSKLRRAV